MSLRVVTEEHLKQLCLPWRESVAVIEQAVRCLAAGDFAQPMKPYLRYRDPTNRIIAMPAFIGGDFNSAGMKWIASFPRNIDHGRSRAHSITIINDADTGVPRCVFYGTLISALRTASVTGLIIEQVNRHRPREHYDVGVIGFGPIGRLHAEMVTALLGDRLGGIDVYDVRPITLGGLSAQATQRVRVRDSWQECYRNANIFITATTSSRRYIDLKPCPSSLLLNVSLRDFKPQTKKHVSRFVVDDWDEVCRENTDIEMFKKQQGLRAEEVLTITDVVCRDGLADLSADEVVMFNPMGMAVFDVALGSHLFRLAEQHSIGVLV